MKKLGVFLVLAVMAIGMVFMGCPSPADEIVTPTGFDYRVPAPKAPNYAAWEAKIVASLGVPNTIKTPTLPQVHINNWVKACDNPIKTPSTKINIWVKKDWADGIFKPTTIELWQSIGDEPATRLDSKTQTGTGSDISANTLKYAADGTPSLTGDPQPGRRLYQFLDLPAYTADNKLITYYVKEVVPEGYFVTYPEPVDLNNVSADGKVKITEVTERVEFAKGIGTSTNNYYYIVRLVNTEVPDTTEFTVTKIWQDNSNQDKIRPSDITLNLKATAGGKSYDVTGYNLVSDKTGDVWTYTFSNLPVLDESGNTFVYSVTEVLPEKYNSPNGAEKITDYSFKITNSYEPPPPPFNPPNGADDVTALWVKKDWGSIANRDTNLRFELYQQIGTGDITLYDTKTWANVYVENVPLLLYYEGNTPKFASSNTPGRDLYQWTDIPATINQVPVTYYVVETGTGIADKYNMVLPWAKDKENLTTFTTSTGASKTGVKVLYGQTKLEYMNRFFHVVLIQNNKK